MSNLIGKTAILAFALSSAFALAACDVDQTQEGELPEVDVNAQGGQMPAYDVETADVDVGTRTETIEVPTMDVQMPDENRAEEAREADMVEPEPATR
ncbi:MAG: hypothetical protein M3Q40_00115 [Pseudomonadota bacterium]|nr:hypothetical protein [Pseudomonadota bacterium]